MIKFAKTKKYKNGFKRGEHQTKPRFGLIPYEPLERLALHYTLGGIRYGFDNWKKAQGEDIESFKEGAIRHILLWGKEDEDHMSAVVWNLFAYTWHTEYKNKKN